MLEWLGSAATSILGGGMTGILGVAVQSVFAFKNKQLDLQLSQQKYDHDLSMKKADAEIMSQEWTQRTKVAQIEATGKENVADAQAFAAAMNEPQRYSESVQPTAGQAWLLVILDFIRGIIRPGLTLYLCILTTLVYFQARVLIKEGMSAAEAYALVQQVTGTILYLTTACVLFWFGTRVKSQPPQIKL